MYIPQHHFETTLFDHTQNNLHLSDITLALESESISWKLPCFPPLPCHHRRFLPIPTQLPDTHVSMQPWLKAAGDLSLSLLLYPLYRRLQSISQSIENFGVGIFTRSDLLMNACLKSTPYGIMYFQSNK